MRKILNILTIYCPARTGNLSANKLQLIQHIQAFLKTLTYYFDTAVPVRKVNINKLKKRNA